MKSLHIVTLAALFLTTLNLGCQSTVYDENKKLWEQNRELQAQKDDLEQRLRAAGDPAALSAMQAELAKRDAEIADLKKSINDNGGKGGVPGLEGIDATYDPRAGTVTVTIPGQVLFDAGKADLKQSSGTTLTKVASAIKKSYPNKPVFVDGFTDTDPITKTKGQWEDNHDLAAARALAVRRYLVSKGISDKSINIRSFGPNKPKSSKEASRRVEIVVVVK